MATITKIAGRHGVRYRAQIRIKRRGQIVHSEAQTFTKRSLAKEWAEGREAELKSRGALERARHQGVTVGDLLAQYEKEATEGYGRTKKSDIRALQRYALAEKEAISLTVSDVIEHLRERRETVVAVTAMNDVVWLREVFAYARQMWGMPLHSDVIDDAAALARKHRLIDKSQHRDRRASDAEIEAICAYFDRWATSVPMRDLIWFAVYSARRQKEITTLRWDDLDREHRTILVRDLKDPRRKGKNRRAKLTPEAYAIITRQPETAPQIFPYKPATIGEYFRRAATAAGIQGLRFHDLRHEATSRLFERGYQIHEVQLFTLHEDWATLKRYTSLRPEDVPDR